MGFVVSINRQMVFTLCMVNAEEKGKYDICISDHFMQINDQPVDVWDYTILETFDDAAVAALSLLVFASMTRDSIRRCIEENGGKFEDV